MTEVVLGGQWNDLSNDFSDPESAAGDTDTRHNKLVLKVDEGNTILIDQLDLVGAQFFEDDLESVPADPVVPRRNR